MKIVIRGTNWIGDAVMTIPAMRSIRRLFPAAHIALHTRSWADGIFQDVDFIDEFITFDGSGSALRTAFEQSRLLKTAGFELAILLPNSFESALAVKMAGIERRIGYSRDARRILLTDAIDVPIWKSERHQVFYYLNLVSEVERLILGTDTTGSIEPDIDLPVSNQRRDAAKNILNKSGAAGSKKSVMLGVGSTNSMAKRWPSENFAELNDRLRAELGVNVILLGSQDEEGVSGKVLRAAALKPIVLTGKTRLDDAAAILAEAELFISNDMGLAHLAPAVGTKTLTIFGPTDPVTTAPFSKHASIVRHEVECSPCMLRNCPIDHRCMTRISVDDVFRAAKELLLS